MRQGTQGWCNGMTLRDGEGRGKGIQDGEHMYRQTDGETMEAVRDFILGGSKITVDGECSHEIKRCLLLRRKAMTNQDSILKSRDTT